MNILCNCILSSLQNTNARFSNPSTAGAAQPQEKQMNGTNDQANEFSKILANSEPEKRRQLIGERLYPRVQQHDSTLAGRITGILLEMEPSELLHLLENEEKLKAKVEEAKIVISTKNKNAAAAADSGKTSEDVDSSAK